MIRPRLRRAPRRDRAPRASSASSSAPRSRPGAGIFASTFASAASAASRRPGSARQASSRPAKSNSWSRCLAVAGASVSSSKPLDGYIFLGALRRRLDLVAPARRIGGEFGVQRARALDTDAQGERPALGQQNLVAGAGLQRPQQAGHVAHERRRRRRFRKNARGRRSAGARLSPARRRHRPEPRLWRRSRGCCGPEDCRERRHRDRALPPR